MQIQLRYHGGDKIRERHWTAEQKPQVIGINRGLLVAWHDDAAGEQVLYVPWSRVVQLRYDQAASVIIDGQGARLPWEPV